MPSDQQPRHERGFLLPALQAVGANVAAEDEAGS